MKKLELKIKMVEKLSEEKIAKLLGGGGVKPTDGTDVNSELASGGSTTDTYESR